MRFPVIKIKTFADVEKNFNFFSILGLTRAVKGTIDTTGPTIIAGKGFTVVKNATGDVTVTFIKSFSVAPIITTGMEDGSLRLVQFSGPTASTCRFARITTAGAGADGKFHFTAEEPT